MFYCVFVLFLSAQSNPSPSRSKRDQEEPHTNHRRRSPTPSSRVRSPINDNRDESFDDSTGIPSKPDPQEDTAQVSTTQPSILPSPSAPEKRRHRWDQDENLNEQQITENNNFENELRMISETSITQSESITLSNDIPQQTIVTQSQSMVSKSKWDDDDDETTKESMPENQNLSES